MCEGLGEWDDELEDTAAAAEPAEDDADAPELSARRGTFPQSLRRPTMRTIKGFISICSTGRWRPWVR
jgi:hypothetical protein